MYHLSDRDGLNTILHDVVQAICDRHLVTVAEEGNDGVSSLGLTLVESLAHQSSAIPASFEEEPVDGFPLIVPISEEELIQKQRMDPAINLVIVQIETGQCPPPSLKAELPDLPLFLHELNRLVLQNGLLYRRRQNGANVTFQLVLPEELRVMVFQSLHNDMGHMGVERTMELVRARFFWSKMQASVEKMIKCCERCVR